MAAPPPQAVKRRGALLLIILLALPLGGCWDTIEVNDRGLVSSIGFDQAPDGSYDMWASVLEPIQLRGRPTPIPTRLLHGRGRTIEDAMHEIQDRYVPRLYLGHLHWILVSERMARSGMRPVMEWLNRSMDRRLSQSLLVAEGPLTDLLSTAAPQAMRSLSVVEDMMANKVGGSSTLGPWLEDLAEAGRDPVTASFRARYKHGELVRKDEYEFAGIVLFRDDRMVGKLARVDSVPFLMLNGDLQGGYAVQSTFKDGGIEKAAITWRGSKSKRKVKVVNGRIRYEVSFTVYGRLSELRAPFDPDDELGIRRVEAALAKEVAAEMKRVFAKLQAAGVDSVGVGQLLHAKHPAYWRTVKKDWQDKRFKDVELVISPKVKMSIRGLTRRRMQDLPTGEESFGAKPEK